jgi:hypothetical protein
MRDVDRPAKARIEEAEEVAQAANLGGILIDSRRSAEIAVTHPWTSPEAKQAGLDYAQAKADTIERTGMFTHVAEPGQVPFWQLGGAGCAPGDPTVTLTDRMR